MNSFFLVRNTLQRVPKIHSLSLWKDSKKRFIELKERAEHASAAECRELVAELVGH